MTGPPEPASPELTQPPELPWEETAEELYDRAPCGYLSTLPDGTIVRVNETFLAWTGYTRADLVGRRRFSELLTAGGRIYHETHFAPLLRMQGHADEIAFDVLRADGRRLPTLVNSMLDRDADGAPRVVRTTLFNATDRRRYEQELLAARRVAERSENRIRLLQQTVADLAASATEHDVAGAMVRAAGAAFEAADATVWLIDRDRAQLLPAGAATEDDPTAAGRPPSAALLVTDVVDRAEPRLVHAEDPGGPQYPELAAWLRQRGRRSLLLAPVAARGAVLGVLALTFVERRVLGDGELLLARLLGQQAGQALERARLYDDARRREGRALLLAEVTRVLDEVHEVLPRAQRLIARLVPGYAGWAAVRPRGAVAALAEGGEPPTDAASLAAEAAEVAATGRPAVVGITAADGGRVLLPLTVRGEVLGTLALRLVGNRRPDEELPFLRDLADRVALALDNARLYEQHRYVAETLQRSLLAGELPRDPRFEVQAHYRAATRGVQVGGDWYDAFMITRDRLAVVVGDVVGRGLDAASTMGQLRSAVRALAVAEIAPAQLIERLDRFVERTPRARMSTVAYAEIVLSRSEMTYACAGHLPPLLQAPGAAPQFLWGGRSAPLGVRRAGKPRTEDRVTLPAGARLLLYTDGLIERRDRSLDEGFALLAREFDDRSAAPLPGLAARLADVLVGSDRRDDVCLLCVGFGAGPRLERAIPAEATQIAVLRRDLRNWLSVNDVDEDTGEAVVLACSETVANAIEHGYGFDPGGVVSVTVALTPEAVHVRVADRGSWRPSRPDDSRGRGLHLVRRMMDDVEVEHAAGTIVSMRRRRAGGRAVPSDS